MILPACQTLQLDFDSGVLTMTFNRPKSRNALSLQMVEEIQSVLSVVDGDTDCRILVLRGSGGYFCAGGDIKDMAAARQSKEAIRDLNRAFGHLISQLDRVSQVVVAVVEGAAMGGGFGLVCVADVVLAEASAKMALPETSLGVIPAQIAPFLVQRIGLMSSRRLALTGATLRGESLKSEGLADEVYDGTEALEAGLQQVVRRAMRCAPKASAQTKRLLNAIAHQDLEVVLDNGASDFAEAVLSAEGMEGMMSFLQKRKPSWTKGYGE